MLRVLIAALEGEKARLQADEVSHLVRVRRAAVGTLFEGVTGDGRKLLCRLERDRTEWFGVVQREIHDIAESPLQITLAQSLIKKDQFEWALQKAVELGAAAFLPIVSQRTEIRLDDRRQEKKLERWQRIIAEAVKQCGRPAVPSLTAPVSLADALTRLGNHPALVLDEAGTDTLETFLRTRPTLGALTVFIGPEGGWDERDRQLFAQADLPRIKLGSRILRAETAALAILALLQYRAGDLSAPASADNGRSESSGSGHSDSAPVQPVD